MKYAFINICKFKAYSFYSFLCPIIFNFIFVPKRYETENGILAEEAGAADKTDEGKDVLRATGFYQFYGPDGVLYRGMSFINFKEKREIIIS